MLIIKMEIEPASSIPITYCFSILKAERQGFKPWIQQSRIADFESAPFDHSGIFP